MVQPAKEGETNKKIKPPLFYISLIIGDKIVHNCMIDSGASRSIIHRCVTDLMGVKYEPMVRDVLQLDGISVKIIGVLKNVEMSLHAYPSCTVTQDISVAKVKPYFSICLSKDFTTQIGTYISSD